MHENVEFSFGNLKWWQAFYWSGSMLGFSLRHLTRKKSVLFLTWGLSVGGRDGLDSPWYVSFPRKFNGLYFCIP